MGSRLSVHAEGATDLADVTFERHSDTAAFGTQTIYGRARGTHASPAVIQSGDSIARLIGVGYDGTDYGQAGEIRLQSVGTPGAGSMGADWIFLTSADGSETPTEKMRLDAKGFLGIGTASAMDTLHVESAENQLARFCSTNGNGRIRISDSSDDLFVGTASGVAFF